MNKMYDEYQTTIKRIKGNKDGICEDCKQNFPVMELNEISFMEWKQSGNFLTPNGWTTKIICDEDINEYLP